MHPVLLKLGNISVYTYGFFIAVGFIVGILLAKREAERRGIDPEVIMDLAFYIIIAAIVGSRLFYVFTTPDVFLENPLEILKIWNGGLVFYGGFILALITAVFYVYRWKLNVWQVADVIAPSIALGQFFGRIGCFSAGCCYGKICAMPWAVIFQAPNSLAPTGIPLHPTQLYHALGNLTIFSILWVYRKKTRFAGQLFWTYVSLYGAVRAVLEIFRDDFRGVVFSDLFSISQVIGILMVVLGFAMMRILGRKNA
jgi:phosphatidylglycerol---prolipoprotein diacylglyceryl transferase